MSNSIEQQFPNLKNSGYQITSPISRRYNCIAWAAGDQSRWWQPEPQARGLYWPLGVAREFSIAAYVAAYATVGFVECDNHQLEPGFEKIALYALNGRPTHAARQLDNGKWTSKLGQMEDIEHTLEGLGSGSYGEVVQILKRPLTENKEEKE